MDLTVVIVNYNVEHFLEQCLLSVRSAIANIDAEVFVVDNNSVDGSCAMVEEKFPGFTLIENRENVGFSKANNQAIRLAKGRYVLLLNPDTVVEEDTFSQTLAFMDAHPDAGGLGVRMVDGKGRFLPESKRGLPTPWVAFCKISGIYRLFPQSRKLNHYYMGFVGEHETSKVEVLSGAFMLLRKAALDQVGLLDEQFFMYGEDIDLSWRIVQGGYSNYYVPNSTIIHYKGESTKKGSLNYVFVFYNAMVIFARKHFSEKNARVFTTFINAAIYARAAVAVVRRFFEKVALPLLDFAALIAGLWGIASYYAVWQSKVYEPMLLNASFAAFASVTMVSVFYSGGYDRPFSIWRLLKGGVISSVLVVLTYAILPEALRFSRAIVLLGVLWMLAYLVFSRGLLGWLAPRAFPLARAREQRFLVVGSSDEFERIAGLIRQTQAGEPEVIRFEAEAEKEQEWNALRERLIETIRVYKADVVIFSGRDLSAANIIELMGHSSDTGVDYKIAPPDSLFMIGSNSIDTSGDLFMLQTNAVSKPGNRRVKRLFDVGLALLLLLAFPVLIGFMKCRLGLFRNVFKVLIGEQTWVGYDARVPKATGLPRIRLGVLSPADELKLERSTRDTIARLNVIYARDYRVNHDLAIVLRNWRRLGCKQPKP